MKKNIFLVIALLVIALTTIQAQDSGREWPSASLLTEYGIPGLAKPAEARFEGWRLQPDMYYYPVIYIYFTGTVADNTAVQNYFKDLNVRFDDSRGSEIDIGYEKDGVRVNYRYDGNRVTMTAGIDR